MKLFVVSDLHTEFSEYAFDPKAWAEAGAIVLPGDIGGAVLTGEWDYLDWVRKTWPDKEIVYVAGNHEYYNCTYQPRLEQLRERSKRHSIHFLENDSVVIGGVRFIGATLWTKFDMHHEQREAVPTIENFIPDFKKIRWELPGRPPRGITPADVLKLCEETEKYLKSQLRQPFDGDTVVVTHFGPSHHSCVPRWRNDLCSGYFMSDFEPLMGIPTLWLHGHIHDSVDYNIEGTRVVCNPRGYGKFNLQAENPLFNDRLIVSTGRTTYTNQDLYLLMLHKRVVEHLQASPVKRDAILERARESLAAWFKRVKGDDEALDWERWDSLLNSYSIPWLIRELQSETEEGAHLRACSPMVGALPIETLMYVKDQYKWLL